MMRLFVVSLILLLYSNVVRTEMATGTLVLPCGYELGELVYFEKLNCYNMWKGVVNVSYYEHLRPYSNTVKLSFEHKVHYLLNDKWHDAKMVQFTGGLTHTFFILDQNLPAVGTLCVNGLIVCNTVQNTPALPSSPIVTTSTTTEAPTTSSKVETTTKATDDDDIDNICGRRKTNMYLSLVSNGDNADVGQWPWHAAIHLKNTRYTNPTCRCGSTILTKKFVVTAAHCVIKNNKPFEGKRLLIIAGITDLTDINCSSCQNSIVKQVYPHPNHSWSKEHYMNDIALLKLKNKFEWTDYVRPICLIPKITKNRLFGEYGTVVGFGATENGTQSDELLYTEVEIHSDEVCYASDRLFFSLFLSPFTICAGNANSDRGPGKGDSGGGMYLKTTTDGVVRWSLQGITSFGKRLPDQVNIDSYVIYTHVNSFFSWISPVVGWND